MQKGCWRMFEAYRVGWWLWSHAEAVLLCPAAKFLRSLAVRRSIYPKRTLTILQRLHGIFIPTLSHTLSQGVQPQRKYGPRSAITAIAGRVRARVVFKNTGVMADVACSHINALHHLTHRDARVREGGRRLDSLHDPHAERGRRRGGGALFFAERWKRRLGQRQLGRK